MYRRFDADTYRAEAAGWNVEKFVNVAAATGRHSVDETLELDAAAEAGGRPDAIIGGLPPADSVAEAIDLPRPADGGPPVSGGAPHGRPRAPPGSPPCSAHCRSGTWCSSS